MRELPTLHREVQVEPISAVSTVGDRAMANFGAQIKAMVDNQTAQETQTALAINSAQAQSTITSKMISLHQEALSSSQDPKEQAAFFNKNAQSFSKEYIESLPEENQVKATQTADSAVQLANKGFEADIIRQQHANNFLAYMDTYNKNMQAMTAAQNAGDNKASQEMYAEIHNNSEGAAKLGFISAKQAASNIYDAQNTYFKNNFIHQVTTLSQTNPLKAHDFLRDVQSKGIEGLTNTEMQSLVSKGYTILNQQKQTTDVDKNVLRKTSHSLIEQTQQTGSYDLDKVQVLQKQLPDEQFKSLMTNLNIAQAHHDKAIELMSMTPDLREQSLNDMRDKDFQNYQQVLQLTSQFSQAFQHDPAEFLQTHPAVMKATNEQYLVNTGLDNTKADVQSKSLLINSPSEAMLQSQKLMGISDDNVKLLTNAQANSIVADLNNDDLSKRIDRINLLTKEYGENTNYVMQQLSASGLYPHALLLSHLPAESQQYIPIAIDSFKTGQKKLAEGLDSGDVRTIKDKVNQNLSDLLLTFSEYNGMDSAQINQMRQSAITLGMGLLSKNKVSDANEAAETASNALFYNNYQTLEFRGKPFRVRANSNIGNQVISGGNALIAQLSNHEFKVPPYFLPNLQEKQRANLYYQQNIENGYLVTNPMTTGVVLVDKNGIPVLNNKDEPYQFMFNDLNNHNSNISNVIRNNIDLNQVKIGGKFYHPLLVE